ncbi:MAG: hypothetical protein CVU05_04140 [Bacteroidetes bacterium HGW-Bacteroidetes-21]|nr:MAG: hypothetical protein CVU05_04140 [Bacteroidetes bacterium HGW-Bacteroidetes-21]
MAPVFHDIHRDLVEQCRKGNRDAFRKLYELYSKAMFSICLRLIDDRHEAEDVLQESFTAAFSRLNEFRHDSTFGAWLKKIVVFKSIDALKKKKKGIEYLDNIERIPLTDTESDPDNDYEKAMSVERIKRAMAKLPDGSRTVFSLYLLEGYDHSEIAGIMNISESTSKSQFLRARQRIKEILKENEYAQ